MPRLDIPPEILKEVRTACRSALVKHQGKAHDSRKTEGVRASSRQKCRRLRAFLDHTAKL